jgi:prepilin-type processing-associated H-X9-DG protein
VQSNKCERWYGPTRLDIRGTLRFPTVVDGLSGGINMESSHRKVAVSIGFLVAAALLVYFLISGMSSLVPAMNSSREAARITICANNLQQIGTALRNYETIKGHLPPVYSVDDSGKPLHSWRTFLLPQFERESVFKQLHLNESWDSPSNKQFAQADVYGVNRCPSDTQSGTYDTNYVAVIGPGTAWQPGKGLIMQEMKDDPHDTILVVELKSSGIRWAEPRDLDLSNLPPGITKDNLLKSLSNHGGGFHALFADGHVEFIPNTIPWQDFEAMLTVAGGETVDRSKW